MNGAAKAARASAEYERTAPAKRAAVREVLALAERQRSGGPTATLFDLYGQIETIIMRIEPERDEWLCGYAAALSCVVRGWGETGLAKEMMAADGLTFDDFNKAGVEEYDLEALKRAK
jgi:hypothetical protein